MNSRKYYSLSCLFIYKSHLFILAHSVFSSIVGVMVFCVLTVMNLLLEIDGYWPTFLGIFVGIGCF